MALKCIVAQTLSGPGEEMSKALSNLIQVGPALERGRGFSQLTFRGPFQSGLFCGSWTGEGGRGVCVQACLFWVERARVRRKKARYSVTRNCCAGEIALAVEI